MAIQFALQNFARNARRPPRVTSVRRQPTNRGGPVVTGRVPQPTTGTGRIVRPPVAKPPTAPAAPAGPLPAIAPVATPAALPVDPSYEGQVAALARQRDDTLLGLAGQRTQGLQDYGYTQAPTGALTFDPSNPFSRAALLRKNYMEGKQGTQTGMAARGQLYSGALQTAQAANDTGFNQGENSLQRALLAFLTSNQGAQNRARSGFETGVAQAMADRVLRAQQDLANNPPIVPDPATQAASVVAAMPVAPGAPRPAGAGPSFISGYQNIPRMKIVNGKAYRLGASGKWIPIK
jgi:hypothetical protein